MVIQQPIHCDISLSECFNYAFLNDSSRAQTYHNVNDLRCDRNSLSAGWYRFSGAAGFQMPESCVPMWRCATHAAGWLSGSHPSVADGSVRLKVCYHCASNCYWQSNYIDVRNCGGFYVYNLEKPIGCSYRYCGNGLQGTVVGTLFLACIHPPPPPPLQR